MKRLAPLILAVPLLLTACSSSEGETSAVTGSATATSSETSDSMTTTAAGNAIEGTVGKQHGLDCVDAGDCSLLFTVESLETLDTCEGFVFDSRPEGTNLVKATVLLETAPSGTDFNAGEFPIWSDWSALTSDGINQDMPASMWCALQDGEAHWNQPVHVGDTERRVHIMDVPEDATEIRLTETLSESRWAFPAPETSTEEAAPTQSDVSPAPGAAAPTPQSQAPVEAPAPTPAAPAAPAPVVGMTEAPGHAQPSAMNKTVQSCGDVTLHQTGTTFFTDGTSGWTQQCADQMMPAAQALLQDQPDY